MLLLENVKLLVWIGLSFLGVEGKELLDVKENKFFELLDVKENKLFLGIEGKVFIE